MNYADKEHRYDPDAEFRFFIWDSGNAEHIYFRSAQDRDVAAHDVISAYAGDGWDECVKYVFAGEITHTAKQCDYKERPDDLDEDDIDGEGICWGDFDYRCDYRLEPLVRQSEPQKLPEQISRDLLGRIVDEVFDGACEDTSAIEEIYRVIMRECERVKA